MKNTKPEKNEFFDINKLPPEEGLLLFPLSMNKLLNKHKPLNIIQSLKHFSPNKISLPKIGVNFIYADFLYLFSNEKAHTLKKKFTEMVWQHSNGLSNLVFKNRDLFQIQNAFSYMTWSQLYLLSKQYHTYLEKINKLYIKDKLFQKYLKQDAQVFNKKLTKNQLDFFLEEHLLFYLILKGQIKLPNEFIQGREKWSLFCYPGNAPKGFIYIFQKNFLNLPQVNKYEGQYNLETKKFIDFHNVDLETYSVK